MKIIETIKHLFSSKQSDNNFTRLYFETSAVNYLFDNVFNGKEFSSIKTKKLQIKKKRKWYISNVTLWEIFLTSDEKRRNELFDFSRCLFYNELIASPEEIIINYINNGCPTYEIPYNLKSKSLFAKDWNKACRNLNYYFEPDRNQLKEHSEIYRFLGKFLTKTAKGYKLDILDELDIKNGDSSILEDSFIKAIDLLGENPTEEQEKLLSITFQITVIIFCYGIGFDQQSIEAFWKKTGVMEPMERIAYTVENFQGIFSRGPIVNISKMIIMQSENGSSRGVYFDAIQSIYTTYADMYLSNDEHFLNFKNTNKMDFNMLKVKSVQDLSLTGKK